jgi:putative hydrolase of the HAD superfamily
VRVFKVRYRLRVVTVSNEKRVLAAYRDDHFGLRSFVDVFVSSGVVGRRKPDPAIYRLALDLVQARPEEVRARGGSGPVRRGGRRPQDAEHQPRVS